MFGRKSNESSNRPSSNSKRSLSQYGLMDMNGLDDDNFEDDENDDDFEAELMALTTDSASKKPSGKKAKQMIDPSDLNKMIQDSLRNIPSDEDVSSGEDDPSILAELEELHGGSTDTPQEILEQSSLASNPMKTLLMERLKMYEMAEENAKKANESSKVRRMSRGVGTLKDLIKKSDAGYSIKEEDIPPAVSVSVPKHDTAPIPAASAESTPANDATTFPSPTDPPPVPPRAPKFDPTSTDSPRKETSEIKTSPISATLTVSSVPNDVDFLKKRQEEYKLAAVAAKKNGDMATALNYVRIVKQFDSVINQASQGAVIDLSTLPPSLNGASLDANVRVNDILPSPLKKQESIKLTSSATDENIFSTAETDASKPDPEPYIAPKTVLEALTQRLKAFQISEEAAKKENNASKVRRMGRIVKQYQDAIKLHKAGKAIPVDELPTPPGFAPIPTDENSPKPVPVAPVPTTSPAAHAAPNKVPTPQTTSTPSKNESAHGTSTGSLTRNEKQLQIVLERQKAYKLAALKAKKEGDLETARQYLKAAKGMDPMIEASRGGLPLDLNSLPLPLDEKKSLDSDYEVVRLNDCIEGTEMDVYQKLIADLQQQMEMCIKTRDHHKAVGDIASANRVEQLASQTKKDLKFVQLAESSNLKIPKFHYETKPFTIVQCNTDLTDNEVEVIVMQGINYNVPNPQEVDTYIKLYFPYPPETPQQFKTSAVYNTNNPVYNTNVKFNIQRNVRACQRIFKRQTVKCEVWSKGGFFRSDTLIGTVNVKLQPLETQCTIHDAFDLMDGRKTVGGKLELKIKVRDPILKKEIVHVEEKWLIIDT